MERLHCDLDCLFAPPSRTISTCASYLHGSTILAPTLPRRVAASPCCRGVDPCGMDSAKRRLRYGGSDSSDGDSDSSEEHSALVKKALARASRARGSVSVARPAASDSSSSTDSDADSDAVTPPAAPTSAPNAPSAPNDGGSGGGGAGKEEGARDRRGVGGDDDARGGTEDRGGAGTTGGREAVTGDGERRERDGEFEGGSGGEGRGAGVGEGGAEADEVEVEEEEDAEVAAAVAAANAAELSSSGSASPVESEGVGEGVAPKAKDEEVPVDEEASRDVADPFDTDLATKKKPRRDFPLESMQRAGLKFLDAVQATSSHAFLQDDGAPAAQAMHRGDSLWSTGSVAEVEGHAAVGLTGSQYQSFVITLNGASAASFADLVRSTVSTLLKSAVPGKLPSYVGSFRACTCAAMLCWLTCDSRPVNSETSRQKCTVPWPL